MTIHEFIFSDLAFPRRSRHFVFWAIYSLIFWVQSINPMDYNEFFEASPYKYAFINLCCFIPVCILSVYLFIYILLPAFLQKRHYLSFVFVFLLYFFLAITINYFFAGLFLNNIHYKNYIEPNLIHKLNFSHVNTIWAITIALLALAIKVTKGWYLQQAENLLNAEKKAKAELRLKKAFIQPDFLVRFLDSISAQIDSSADESGVMILALSELLSYSLYEGNKKLVPLNLELSALHDFISLSKKISGSSLDIGLVVHGEKDNKYVHPMIVISMLQDGIRFFHNIESKWQGVAIEMDILENRLSTKLSFLSDYSDFLRAVDCRQIVENTRHRLNVFFSPEEYRIQIIAKRNEGMIKLVMPFSHDPSRKLGKANHIVNDFT